MFLETTNWSILFWCMTELTIAELTPTCRCCKWMFVCAAAKKQASLSGQLISVSSPHHTETLVLVTSHNTTNENQTMTKTVCFKNNCPNQVIWHECTHCTTNFCHECSQLMNGFRIWMCGSFRSFSQMFCTFVLVDCMTECTLMCCCCECLFVCAAAQKPLWEFNLFEFDHSTLKQRQWQHKQWKLDNDKNPFCRKQFNHVIWHEGTHCKLNFCHECA